MARASRREYDPLDFRHNRITGPVTGIALAVFAAVVGYVFHVPGWVPAIPAAVAVVATVVVGRHRGTGWATVIYRSACWAGPGIWAGWVVATGPSWLAVAVLATMAIVAGIVWPAFAPEEEAKRAPTARRTPMATPFAVEWRNRIIRVCRFRDGLDILRVDQWPNNSGATLYGEFPEGSPNTWEEIAVNFRGLGAAARLPSGCVVRAAEGEHQGAFLVEVPRINALAQPVQFPMDLPELSVNKPFGIGVRMDSRTAPINLREAAGLIVGRRGEGKTNCLHVLTGQLCCCRDVVIWHVDLNGGGMAVPWVFPYANGDVDTPAVDWVAADPDEAVRMATVALAIAKDRKAAYGRLKIDANSAILPVTANLPEIVILIDEGAEVMGETSKAWKAREAFEEVLRIGRAEAVNVVFSGLRATSSVVSAMVLSQCQLRVATKVKDDADLAYLFGWQKLRSNDLMFKGCTFMQTDDGATPEQVRWYHLLPQRIGDIARATADRRSALDLRAQAIGGDVYAGRWERTRPLLLTLASKLDDGSIPAGAVNPAPALAAPEPVAATNPVDTLAAARTDAERTARNLELAAYEAKVGRWMDREFGDLADAFKALDDDSTDGEEDSAPVLVEDRPDPGRLAVVLEIVDAAGAAGTGPKEIREQLLARGTDVSRQTIHGDLGKLVEAGSVVKPNNKQGLYVAARHIDGPAQ